GERIGGIRHEPRALLQAVDNLDITRTTLPDAHLAPHGPAVVDRVHGPVAPDAEQRGRRHLEDSGRIPDHDADLDTVPVAETRERLARVGIGLDRIDDDVDALLLDTERRDLR